MSNKKELRITYSTFKNASKGLSGYYVHFPSDNTYYLIAVSDDYVYSVSLTTSSEISDFENNYKTKFVSVGSEEDAIAKASIANRTNKVTPKTDDGKKLVSTWPTEGSKTTAISPNWCDKTTWYHNAIRVDGYVAYCDNAPTYTIYDMGSLSIIDTYHGKISGEDFLKSDDGYSFRVTVKVNGVEKTEQDPHYGSGGDYTINYDTGKITFLNALTESDVVTTTYFYASGSEWVLSPLAGKTLKVSRAEVQFSDDIEITDTIIFQAYGLVDVFAPQLVNNPFPSGTKIPLGDADVMKTIMDYINDANGAYPEIPALGGGGWRGMSRKIITFPWDYQSVTDLFSSAGMEIRIKLEHDVPFNGAVATATFYCLSVDESE